jgi:hypothetical protein
MVEAVAVFVLVHSEAAASNQGKHRTDQPPRSQSDRSHYWTGDLLLVTNNQRDAICELFSNAGVKLRTPAGDFELTARAKSLRGRELFATRFRVVAPTGHVWRTLIEAMNSRAAELSGGRRKIGLTPDRPTFRSSITGQALKGQPLWLEVQDHVMSTQSTEGLPQTPGGQPGERDRATAGRDALRGPPGRVNACGKHDRLESNESATVARLA